MTWFEDLIFLLWIACNILFLRVLMDQGEWLSAESKRITFLEEQLLEATAQQEQVKDGK